MLECVRELVELGVLSKRDMNGLKKEYDKIREGLVGRLDEVMNEIREFNESEIVERLEIERI